MKSRICRINGTTGLGRIQVSVLTKLTVRSLTKPKIGCLFSQTKKTMEKSKARRTFDLELKLDLVKKIDQGQLSVSEVSQLYDVSRSAVHKWIRKYSDLYQKRITVVVERKSLSKKYKEQQDLIKELERALGQKQMRVDYLEKLIDTASERLGEDIEKKTKRLP